MLASVHDDNSGIVSLQTACARVNRQRAHRRARSVDVLSRGISEAAVTLIAVEGHSGFSIVSRRTFVSIEYEDGLGDVDEGVLQAFLPCNSVSDGASVRKERAGSRSSDSTKISVKWSEIDEDSSSDLDGTIGEGETVNVLPAEPPGNFVFWDNSMSELPCTLYAVQDYDCDSMAQEVWCSNALPCVQQKDTNGPPGFFFENRSPLLCPVGAPEHGYNPGFGWFEEGCDNDGAW